MVECKDCSEHSGIEAKVKQNEKDIGTIYEILEKVRNRLPHWATIALSAAFLVIGWLIAYKFGKG
jgi:hypothetical protein